MVQLCLIFFSSGRGTPVEEWLWFELAWHHNSHSREGHSCGQNLVNKLSQDCLALFAASEIAGVVTWPNDVKLLGNHSSDNGWLCEYVTEIQMVKLSTETHEVTKKHLLSPINTRSWSKHMVILQFTNAKCSFSQRSVQFLVQTCTLTRVLHLRSVITVNKYTF